MSELLKWFGRRREEKVLTLVRRHLATTMTAVEDLEKAVRAATVDDEREVRLRIDRVTNAEREADGLRREAMNELARGELPPVDREDLMHLVKRVDMVADWSLEATRILNATPVREVPRNLRKACVEMAEGVKECASALQRSINRIAEKPEEALRAADQVERREEMVDGLFQNARGLLAKEAEIRVGVAILMNELFEALEMVADSCEDACDQVRVIIVRR
ncbi:MAG: DUF47 domain-containing protein [Candidatus Bathyarchaeia archaeon]